MSKHPPGWWWSKGPRREEHAEVEQDVSEIGAIVSHSDVNKTTSHVSDASDVVRAVGMPESTESPLQSPSPPLSPFRATTPPKSQYRKLPRPMSSSVRPLRSRDPAPVQTLSGPVPLDQAQERQGQTERQAPAPSLRDQGDEQKSRLMQLKQMWNRTDIPRLAGAKSSRRPQTRDGALRVPSLLAPSATSVHTTPKDDTPSRNVTQQRPRATTASHTRSQALPSRKKRSRTAARTRSISKVASAPVLAHRGTVYLASRTDATERDRQMLENGDPEVEAVIQALHSQAREQAIQMAERQRATDARTPVVAPLRGDPKNSSEAQYQLSLLKQATLNASSVQSTPLKALAERLDFEDKHGLQETTRPGSRRAVSARPSSVASSSLRLPTESQVLSPHRSTSSIPTASKRGKGVPASPATAFGVDVWTRQDAQALVGDIADAFQRFPQLSLHSTDAPLIDLKSDTSALGPSELQTWGQGVQGQVSVVTGFGERLATLVEAHCVEHGDAVRGLMTAYHNICAQLFLPVKAAVGACRDAENQAQDAVDSLRMFKEETELRLAALTLDQANREAAVAQQFAKENAELRVDLEVAEQRAEAMSASIRCFHNIFKRLKDNAVDKASGTTSAAVPLEQKAAQVSLDPSGVGGGVGVAVPERELVGSEVMTEMRRLKDSLSSSTTELKKLKRKYQTSQLELSQQRERHWKLLSELAVYAKARAEKEQTQFRAHLEMEKASLGAHGGVAATAADADLVQLRLSLMEALNLPVCHATAFQRAPPVNWVHDVIRSIYSDRMTYEAVCNLQTPHEPLSHLSEFVHAWFMRQAGGNCKVARMHRAHLMAGIIQYRGVVPEIDLFVKFLKGGYEVHRGVSSRQTTTFRGSMSVLEEEHHSFGVDVLSFALFCVLNIRGTFSFPSAFASGSRTLMVSEKGASSRLKYILEHLPAEQVGRAWSSVFSSGRTSSADSSRASSRHRPVASSEDRKVDMWQLLAALTPVYATHIRAHKRKLYAAVKRRIKREIEKDQEEIEAMEQQSAAEMDAANQDLEHEPQRQRQHVGKAENESQPRAESDVDGDDLFNVVDDAEEAEDADDVLNVSVDALMRAITKFYSRVSPLAVARIHKDTLELSGQGRAASGVFHFAVFRLLCEMSRLFPQPLYACVRPIYSFEHASREEKEVLNAMQEELSHRKEQPSLLASLVAGILHETSASLSFSTSGHDARSSELGRMQRNGPRFGSYAVTSTDTDVLEQWVAECAVQASALPSEATNTHTQSVPLGRADVNLCLFAWRKLSGATLKLKQALAVGDYDNTLVEEVRGDPLGATYAHRAHQDKLENFQLLYFVRRIIKRWRQYRNRKHAWLNKLRFPRPLWVAFEPHHLEASSHMPVRLKHMLDPVGELRWLLTRISQIYTALARGLVRFTACGNIYRTPTQGEEAQKSAGVSFLNLVLDFYLKYYGSRSLAMRYMTELFFAVETYKDCSERVRIFGRLLKHPAVEPSMVAASLSEDASEDAVTLVGGLHTETPDIDSEGVFFLLALQQLSTVLELSNATASSHSADVTLDAPTTSDCHEQKSLEELFDLPPPLAVKSDLSSLRNLVSSGAAPSTVAAAGIGVGLTGAWSATAEALISAAHAESLVERFFAVLRYEAPASVAVGLKRLQEEYRRECKLEQKENNVAPATSTDEAWMHLDRLLSLLASTASSISTDMRTRLKSVLESATQSILLLSAEPSYDEFAKVIQGIDRHLPSGLIATVYREVLHNARYNRQGRSDGEIIAQIGGHFGLADLCQRAQTIVYGTVEAAMEDEVKAKRLVHTEWECLQQTHAYHSVEITQWLEKLQQVMAPDQLRTLSTLQKTLRARLTGFSKLADLTNTHVYRTWGMFRELISLTLLQVNEHRLEHNHSST